MDVEVWMKVAKAPIHRYFEQSARKVFGPVELLRLLEENRKPWRLPGVAATDFLRLLPRFSRFTRVHLPMRNRKEVFYAWGDHAILGALQAGDPEAFFSHHTALELHGLAAMPSQVVYINVGQPSRSDGAIRRMVRIDAPGQPADPSARATASRPLLLFSEPRADAHGVVNTAFPGDPGREPLRVTNIERTLIDVALQPAYAGGPRHVLTAYRAAKDRVNVERLVSMLRASSAPASAHQVIGFCLERAGHADASLSLLRGSRLEHSFCGADGDGQTTFIPRWRLHVPLEFVL